MSEIIVRRVKVDRNRSPQEVIDATGRAQYATIDKDAIATMPRGEGDEVEVWFVPAKRSIPPAEVPAFLAQYGLVPDPRAVAAANEADPAFADRHPNGAQWQDAEGRFCCLTFIWSSNATYAEGARYVGCNRAGNRWHGTWFIAGVPAPGK